MNQHEAAQREARERETREREAREREAREQRGAREEREPMAMDARGDNPTATLTTML